LDIQMLVYVCGGKSEFVCVIVCVCDCMCV